MFFQNDTFINVDVSPDVLTLSYHASLTSGYTGTDKGGNLDRMVVLDFERSRSKRCGDDSVDCRRKDDKCTDET